MERYTSVFHNFANGKDDLSQCEMKIDYNYILKASFWSYSAQFIGA